MNKLRLCLITVICTLSTILCSLNGYCETLSADTKHIEQTLQSAFVSLSMNADVMIPDESTLFKVYTTDYGRASDPAWKTMFFGDPNALVKDEWVGWDLEKNQVFYPELEHKYSQGNILVGYDAHRARLFAQYRDVEVLIQWGKAKEDIQADGLKTTPSKATSIAQQWVNSLAGTIGWKEYSMATCWTFPPTPAYILSDQPNAENQTATGFYIVEFRRIVDNLPIAIDSPRGDDDTRSRQLYGDVLQIFIDDSGVFRVDGFYRSFIEEKTERLNITLENAINTLSENMDFVSFFQTDDVTEINEIELCYRLVQSLPTHDKDVNAITQARPAWRFASCIKRNGHDPFVMFIDAITGEILP